MLLGNLIELGSIIIFKTFQRDIIEKCFEGINI